jgi:GxxExxY protein
MEYDLAGHVIGVAMKVHSFLGPGYAEQVYKNAMALDLVDAGFEIEVEKRLAVHYRGRVIGDYVADMVVGGILIVEFKAVQKLVVTHEVQLVNYLTTTGIDEGLLLNFGAERLEYRKKYRGRRSA